MTNCSHACGLCKSVCIDRDVHCGSWAKSGSMVRGVMTWPGLSVAAAQSQNTEPDYSHGARRPAARMTGTATLWALEQSVGHSAPAVQPWSHSEAPPKTPISTAFDHLGRATARPTRTRCSRPAPPRAASVMSSNVTRPARCCSAIMMSCSPSRPSRPRQVAVSAKALFKTRLYNTLRHACVYAAHYGKCSLRAEHVGGSARPPIPLSLTALPRACRNSAFSTRFFLK